MEQSYNFKDGVWAKQLISTFSHILTQLSQKNNAQLLE